MKSKKKLLTGIIAVVSCVLATLIIVSILLSDKNFNGGVEDNSVSAGYVSSGETMELSPYFCAYRFETNVYEANAVNSKVSYAIDDNIFGMCYDNMLYYCDQWQYAITEYNIYLVMQNVEVAMDLISSISNLDPTYAQQLKEYETGTVQNGVYIHEKFEFKDLNSFPFDKYSLTLYRNEKNQLISDFAYTEEITIPEQLFADDSGCIEICLVECVIYDDGHISYNMNTYPFLYFHYLKEGTKIKISKTEL